MRPTLRARLSAGDDWERKSNVDVGLPENVALEGEATPFSANVALVPRESIPTLEPLLRKEGVGACSGAVVLSLR